jgi:hypothetical protein
LLGQGKVREAQQESVIALKLAASTQLRQVQWKVRIIKAKTEAAAGNLAGAVSVLKEVTLDAEKHGLFRMEMAARLALGQAKIKNGRNPNLDAELKTLEAEARARGFTRIAGKAGKL